MSKMNFSGTLFSLFTTENVKSLSLFFFFLFNLTITRTGSVSFVVLRESSVSFRLGLRHVQATSEIAKDERG